MKLFLVITDNETVESANIIKRKLEELYKDFYYPLRNGVSWVVATNGNATTESLAKNLDITSEAERSANGVIIKIENYYGRYDRALWEQMATWVETS